MPRHIPRRNYTAVPAEPVTSEADHFIECPVCRELLDMRDLGAVFDHACPGTPVEVTEG